MQRAKVSVSRQRWDETNGKLATLESETAALRNRIADLEALCERRAGTIAMLINERDRLRGHG